MSLKKLTRAVGCVLLLLSLSIAHAQSDSFSRRDMLANIAESIILPLHYGLVEEVNALDAAMQAFSAQPTPETLSAARGQWLSAMRVWRQASLFELGRQTLILHAALESNVTPNTDYIESLIADNTIVLDEAFLQTQGSNVIGFGTLEYLLYGMAATTDAHIAQFTGEIGARRVMYATTVSTMLTQSTRDLLNYWLPEGDDYLRAFISSDDPVSVRQSISMLVNAMIGNLENIANFDFAVPMGLQTGQPAPELVRSPYSNVSLELAIGSIETIRDVFSGGEGDALGLNDYIDSLGLQLGTTPLTQVISSELELVLADLRIITPPLRTALAEQPEAMQQMYTDLRRVYLLMKTNMVSQMGITITFTDSDGD
jgi:uncharacterized protein